MRSWKMTALAVCVAAVCCEAAGPTKADIDAALAKVPTYTRAADRTPLFAVEELIRQTYGQPELRKHIEQKLADMLGSDATLDARDFICRQLWSIGSDVSVPALAKMLADEKTVDMACYALARNPSPAAGKALRDALRADKPRLLIPVINRLGERGDAECVDAMSRFARGNEEDVAAAAIFALGKIGGPQAVKTLAEVRTKPSAKAQLAAADALLACAEVLTAQGKKAEAAAIYRELSAARESELVRGAAVRGLARISGQDAVPLVLAALRDASPVIRATGIECVREMKGEQAVEPLAAELPQLPEAGQVLLIDALADLGGAAARRAIAAAAASESQAVRMAALKALGKVGDASCVAVLVGAAAESGNSEQGRAAMASLVGLRGKDVDAALLKLADSGDVKRRLPVIRALADRGCADAVPVLLKAARDQAPEIRAASFEALSTLAGPEQTAALMELLLGVQADVERAAAEKAIVSAARKGADEATQADAVLAKLSGAPGEAAKCSLIRVLGGIANDKSLAAVRAATADVSPSVQDAAIRALAAWPKPGAADALGDILRTATNETHRVLALRGYVRLLELDRDRPTRETVERLKQAMSLARRTEERRLVLAGFANVNAVEALDAVVPYLRDDALKAEAAAATVKIALAVHGANREAAKGAMNKVLAAVQDENIRSQAKAVVDQIEKLEDFVTSWQVTGPYEQEGKDYKALFDIAFDPEQPDAKGVKWQLMPPGPNKDRPWMFDLLKLFGGEQKVAYLRTWIQSGKPQEARLELGTDDGVKAWLNGSLVHANNVARAAEPGQDTAKITLKQGWNVLLLKITQNNMMWDACARLRKPDGTRLEGIQIDCTPQPAP